jgi:tellurite resistance protein
VNIDSWLKELKVPREAYRVVSLLPLAYVAWADGKIQKAERDLIMRIAKERGLLEHGGADALERWLSEPPSKAQLKKDLGVLNDLARDERLMGDELGADQVQLLLAWCQDVADAAGGLLGLKKARTEGEAAALKTIASALDVRSARQWRAFVGD